MNTPATKGTQLVYGLDQWLKELDQYNFTQLTLKPSATTWSMGQLYIHLIEATNFFIKQIRVCIASDENTKEEHYPAARLMFNNDAFPDQQLQGPPSNAITPQPESKAQIVKGLNDLKQEVHNVEVLIAQSRAKGKTKHFGLGYFTALEWLHFAEMHCRHHLRQKKRLDEFLKASLAS